ncbi:STAS/SEC14 domain-containing protein [Pontixanthobacter aquaemixtae]|uniref:STAS/SEC14 domain-containing protein n=1 Tax=Pontixanthobacter aquaemixtae TaxID=1958940 RepID=A0A844ZV86_9SPHN|nr:STAS/SEC14 domain-containing protein [Pontixanthobacter aquaemixtae]MXO90677.1 hypothetical protein [Pontixanthobacter aquaemixtae]
MAITDRIVSARLNEEHGELHYRCGGLWDEHSIDELFDCLNRASEPLVRARKPIYALGDFTTAMPQVRATAEKIGAHLRNAKEFGLERMAIYGAPILMRMQYKRFAPDVNVEFFDTKGQALNWLREGR